MKKLILISIFFLVPYAGLKSQTTLSIEHRTAYYYASFFDGGGYFDNSSDEVGMWANTAISKQTALWRQLKTTGNNTGSLRPMQTGDKMTITVAAKRARGRIGCALLSSPIVGGSWANRESNYAISVNLDGPLNTGSFWGNWYIKFKDGGTSSTNFGGTESTFYNYTFEFILTSSDRMNVNIYDNNGHSYSFYDIQVNNTNPITDYSIYLEDDNNGSSNQNIYWKPTSSMMNTGLLTIGQSNTSYTISTSITDGLEANSTSSVSVNALTKSGTGTIILEANSPYSGATTISAGTLELQANLANSDVTVVNGATLRVNGTDVTVKSLTVNAGGNVEIEPGKSLTVTGTFVNSGTLTIKSDATATGSLIVNGTVSGNVTIERYIAAWGSGTQGWHFLSAPVAGQDFQPEFVPNPPTTSEDFYLWDEPNSQWVNSKLGSGPFTFNEASFGTEFVTGKGYLVSYASNVTKNFTGVPNNSDVSNIALTYTSTSAAKGWNLLGNPFPSGLTWNVSSWKPGNTIISGTAKIVNSLNASYEDITGGEIIPAMNGFLVYTSAATTLSIPEESRTHSNNWYKQGNELEKLVLKVIDLDGQTAQKTQLILNPEATSGFDFLYDSEFLPFLAPSLYTVVEGKQLSTNSIPSITGNMHVPVHFVKNNGTNFMLEAENIAAFGTEVNLVDNKTGQITNLYQNPSYSFTAENGDEPERFELHFGLVSLSELPQPTPLKAYITNGKLYFPLQGDATLEMIDLLGRMLMNTKVSGNGLTSKTMELPAGVYMVQLSYSNIRQTAKVVVK